MHDQAGRGGAVEDTLTSMREEEAPKADARKAWGTGAGSGRQWAWIRSTMPAFWAKMGMHGM